MGIWVLSGDINLKVSLVGTEGLISRINVTYLNLSDQILSYELIARIGGSPCMACPARSIFVTCC